MDHVVGPEAFESCPLLITDAAGRVSLCNRAASSLFDLGSSCPLGRRCWEVMRFVRPGGSRFCSKYCPIQREAGAGTLDPRHWVALASPGAEPVQFELLTFVLPPPSKRRRAVLHLILPAPPLAADAAAPSRIDRLTPREKQVLRLMASGYGTPELASRLGISTATVRNHVQHLLKKLEVHGRLEAILALLRGSAADRGPPVPRARSDLGPK